MHTVSLKTGPMLWLVPRFTRDQYPPQSTELVMDVDDAVIMTDALNGIVTPSHRIPPEIVAKIIHELLPEKVDYGPLVQKRIEVLLTATSICRYWRHAALDYATLWSVVPIDRKSLGGLFLQRSRNATLLITFEVNTRRCCPAHQAMVLLLPYIQRVKKVQFRAPVPVLNDIFSALNLYGNGAQLVEISLKVDRFPGDEKYRAILDLLLEHAPTLKVLRLDVSKCRSPAHKLRQFSHLSHLELLTTHDINDISPLLTSLPTLTSIKIHASALGTREDDRRPPTRIVPQANLRHIHLQIMCYPPNPVLDSLKVQTGVHLECEILGSLFPSIQSTRCLPLPSESFENTLGIEELRIAIPSYSGSGPNGSFRINGIMGAFLPPIEDFSHLRKLVVEGTIEWRSLEHVVGSAPRLVSVGFINCTVVESRAVTPPPKRLRSPVDTDTFVELIGGKRRVDADGGDHTSSITVNGTLEGERLEEFRSLLGSRG